MLRSCADRIWNFPKTTTGSAWTGKKQMSQITVIHCQITSSFAKFRWRDLYQPFPPAFHQRKFSSTVEVRRVKFSLLKHSLSWTTTVNWRPDVGAGIAMIARSKTKTATKMTRYSTLLSANTGKSMKSRQNVDSESLWEGSAILRTLKQNGKIVSNSTGARLVYKWTSFGTWNGTLERYCRPVPSHCALHFWLLCLWFQSELNTSSKNSSQEWAYPHHP